MILSFEAGKIVGSLSFGGKSDKGIEVQILLVVLLFLGSVRSSQRGYDFMERRGKLIKRQETTCVFGEEHHQEKKLSR